MRVSRICKKCGFSSLLKDYNVCPVCGDVLIDPGFLLGYKMVKFSPFKPKLDSWIEKQNGYPIPEELIIKREQFYKKEYEKHQQEKQQAIEQSNKAHYQSFLDNQKNVPKCPTCGSTNISNIGTIERGVSVGMVGLASSKIGKTKKCKSCGYSW